MLRNTFLVIAIVIRNQKSCIQLLRIGFPMQSSQRVSRNIFTRFCMRNDNEKSSTLFFCLLSNTDHKEKINQFSNNMKPNPIDCSLEFLKSFSPDKVDFQPHLLNSSDPEKRDPQVELLHNFFRQMAETSNTNLIRNCRLFTCISKG